MAAGQNGGSAAAALQGLRRGRRSGDAVKRRSRSAPLGGTQSPELGAKELLLGGEMEGWSAGALEQKPQQQRKGTPVRQPLPLNTDAK
jgi:hypothetical protein